MNKVIPIMRQMPLSKLIEGFSKQTIEPPCSINGIALDSRQIKNGFVFVALQGSEDSGEKFIADAIAQGAKAILVDASSTADPKKIAVPLFKIKQLPEHLGEIAQRFYRTKNATPKLIAVTGTNGKTSVTHLIGQVLAKLNKPTAVSGTLGHGLLPNLIRNTHTTPDVFSNHELISQFAVENFQYVALEASSHALAQERLAKLPIATGIFTNLTRDHLDYHQTMEAYGAAKMRLFERAELTNAVINADDVFGQQILNRLLNKVNTVSFSTSSKRADVRAEQIVLAADGIQAQIITPWGEQVLRLPLLGQFNLSNALAVIAALGLEGFSLDKICQALADCHGVKGRMQVFAKANKATVVVDYAHTPDALQKALISLRAHCQGKLFCVFGCGGDRDKTKRPVMGAIACKQADVIVVTDDNPRTEDAETIFTEIRAGMQAPEAVQFIHDRSQAIEKSFNAAGPGDLILVAGKGHEDYQILNDRCLVISDIDIVEKLLNDDSASSVA